MFYCSLCRLNGCGITDEGCAALASALISNPSHLRELDLSFNKLEDKGVHCLSDGLKNPLCKVEKLKYDLFGRCVYRILVCPQYTYIQISVSMLYLQAEEM